MLALQLDDFMIEFDDGAVKNVGPPTKTAAAKLFDVAEAEARAFGDKRVKLVFADDDGNEVQVALFPEDARRIEADLERLENDHPAFE